jgi:glycosyltransferase involved in cell wall biosynthesis
LGRFPETAFIVAGKGFLLDSLKEEVKSLNLEKNFFFLGPRLDLPEILQILDVYVLPSEWEGLPLVILEAMAARRAIVATNVGGNSVAIEHDKSGYLVPPQKPMDLADKVCDLLSDPQKRERFSNAAHEKFYSAFEVKHMVHEYERLYLNVARAKGLVKP